MSVRILIGDSRERLAELADGSVNCCVTSPPYFGLRDYGCEGQMGLEPTPDEYVAGMVALFREVRRVLRDDGVLFLNIGDSYYGSGKRGNPEHSPHKKQRTNAGSLSVAGRATACDTSGKAPEGSLASDCFCQSLCGACREAYRIGKSHSARSLAPTPSASSCASSPEHTGSQSDRLPTSDSAHRHGHNSTATPDLALVADREGEPLPDAQASTMPQSSQQSPETCLPDESQGGECRLCARSLQRSSRASAHTAECICDSAPLASVDRNQGMDVSGSAYPSYTTASLKPKDLIGIPWMLAFALRADGWYLRQDIIWSKPNPMPESVRDRCTKAHEYIFMLSKSARYHYDAAAIRTPPSDALLQQVRDGYAGSDTKPFAVGGAQSASGTKARIIEGARKKLDKQRGHARRHDGFNDRWDAMSREEQMALGSNKRSVWEVATQPFAEAHFATYPPALIEPCILAGCPQGGTVLDPFGGAGTTGLVADRLGRNAILIELNPEYAAIAERRLTADAGMFAEVKAA